VNVWCLASRLRSRSLLRTYLNTSAESRSTSLQKPSPSGLNPKPRGIIGPSPLTSVSKDFIAQTGDPTATGTGGESLSSYLYSLNESSGRPSSAKPPRYFLPEINNKLKHASRGTVSMAIAPTNPPGCGSQFFITLADGIEYLDGKHAVFGHVIEGLDTLDKINEAFLDKEGRPLQDIRIRHVEILGECRVSTMDPPYGRKRATRIQSNHSMVDTRRFRDVHHECQEEHHSSSYLFSFTAPLLIRCSHLARPSLCLPFVTRTRTYTQRTPFPTHRT
jgi:cyclophilin family peptidyl-prolyl cis-trans isomerase